MKNNLLDIQNLAFVNNITIAKEEEYTYRGKNLSELLDSVIPSEMYSVKEKRLIIEALPGYLQLPIIEDSFENNLEGKNKRNTSLNSLSKELREKYYKNKIKPRMIVGAINILKLYFPDHYTSRAAIFEEYLKSISSFDQKTIFEKKQIAYLFSKQLKIVITEIINPLAIG